MAENARGALVFGARNLEKGDHRNAAWSGLERGRRRAIGSTLEGVAALGALAIRADVTDPGDVTRSAAGVRGRARPARSRRKRRGRLRR